MKNIVKTNAVVIRKINYGDTSKIATVFTEQLGKISLIVKGGRSSKSRTGNVIDIFNIVEIVCNYKETRDIQILSQTELLHYFPKLIEDFNKSKYALAVLELINALLPENEPHPLIYKSVERLFILLNESHRNPKELFTRFLLFFCKEIGYEFNPEFCTFCGKPIEEFSLYKFNYDYGILCPECSKNKMISFEFSQELFKIIKCLSSKNSETNYRENDLDTVISFIQRFLNYNIPEFKGLKSLKI